MHPHKMIYLCGHWRAVQVRDIFATALESTRENVWGWLAPASEALPHVLLKGRELALGRGSGGGGDRSATGDRPERTGGGSLREPPPLSMHEEEAAAAGEQEGQCLGDLLQPSASVSSVSRQAAGPGPAFHLSSCGLAGTAVQAERNLQHTPPCTPPALSA